MKLFNTVVLSTILSASTALSLSAYAACVNCGQSAAVAPAPRQTEEYSIFNNRQPRIIRQEIFPEIQQQPQEDSSDWRKAASGPIFGDNDCSPSGPMFGPNTCTKRKCGGAMFGPQTCERVEVPCDSCKKAATPAPAPIMPQRSFIQNYKTIPAEPVYERIHKCSDLASFQLEWVDFRIQDGNTAYSRKLGNYRFRMFGCRRFSKKAMLNEGRIIQKNMQFIDIFENLVDDCYNIVKVPNDLCLRDQNYEAPEYILTAEITDYFMNICDGYDWNRAEKTDRRTGSAEMTVTWRLLDLTKTKVIWKGETTGYRELDEGSYNGEIDLIERAFADASLNLKGMPEFEEQLAHRIPPEILEQQKTTLLAIEQASDPIKCKLQVPPAASCPVPEAFTTEQPQQCPMPAEVLEYVPQSAIEYIPLEQVRYVEAPTVTPVEYVPIEYTPIVQTPQRCPTVIEDPCSPLYQYIKENNMLCGGDAFTGQPNCNPALTSFLNSHPECIEYKLEQAVLDQPQTCMFVNQFEPAVESGISKDTGFYIPEVETVEVTEEPKPTADWQPYVEPEVKVEENGNYRTSDHFCIENVPPYPDMRPENLYRVRASMMSIRNGLDKQYAGLLISDNLILTTADAINDEQAEYNIETINGVKTTAKLVRVNVKKNTALLQTTQKMEFRPLSLQLELPTTGQSGYMSLGLLNNSDGENYLDDKGTIKGYRFSDEMGTEIITDTFVQTVSSGGALINDKGTVAAISSRSRNVDNKGDLFMPIQEAINSVSLEVCGQTETFTPPPSATAPSVADMIDGYTGSKEPSVMKGKRK